MQKSNGRMDIVSRKVFEKKDLLRYVRVNGTLVLDENMTLPGRGAYLKKDLASLEKAIAKKCFERAFHLSLDEATIARSKQLCQD